MSYDNSNQVILSKVVSENPNAPALRITLELNGQKYKAGLWNWDRKDGSNVVDKAGNAQYIGKLEIDDFVPNNQSGAGASYPDAGQGTPQTGNDFDVPF